MGTLDEPCWSLRATLGFSTVALQQARREGSVHLSEGRAIRAQASAEDVPFGRKRPVSLVARQGERGRRFLWVERAACEGVCHRVKC